MEFHKRLGRNYRSKFVSYSKIKRNRIQTAPSPFEQIIFNLTKKLEREAKLGET
jgi:hypothetical protein